MLKAYMQHEIFLIFNKKHSIFYTTSQLTGFIISQFKLLNPNFNILQTKLYNISIIIKTNV